MHPYKKRMAAGASIALLLLTLMLLLPVNAEAVAVQDQSQLQQNVSCRSPGMLAQTFTAGVSRRLTQVSIYGEGAQMGGAVAAEVRTVRVSGDLMQLGAPSETVLASSLVRAPMWPGPSWHEFDLFPAPLVEAGQQYAIVLTSDVTWYGYCLGTPPVPFWPPLASWPTDVAGPYPGGQPLSRATGMWCFDARPFDFMFRTKVQPLADIVPPVISGVPTDLILEATSPSGGVATWSQPVATDPQDGPVEVSSNWASGDTFPLGTTTVTFSAVDCFGNMSTDDTFRVTVNYGWTGILDPINVDGTSVFNAGRTVPVKFALRGLSVGVHDAIATLEIAKLSDNVVGTELEADSTSSATTDNLFRYDATSGGYSSLGNERSCSRHLPVAHSSRRWSQSHRAGVAALRQRLLAGWTGHVARQVSNGVSAGHTVFPPFQQDFGQERQASP